MSLRRFLDGTHIAEKKQIKNKRTWYRRYLRKWVWVTYSCPMPNVYDGVPRVRGINTNN